MAYYVYRYMIGDQWIYVGQTHDGLRDRMLDHTHDDRFGPYRGAKVDVCILNSASDMDFMEKALIKIMKPVLNMNDATDSEMPFKYLPSKIKWYPIDEIKPMMKSLAGCPDDPNRAASITEDIFKECLDKIWATEEYVSYYGPMYKTAIVPKDVLYRLLNIKGNVPMLVVAGRINQLGKLCKERLGGKIISAINYAHRSFMLSYYSL